MLSLAPNDDASKDVSRGQALFLAAMAKHHSDSIVSLPGPLRKKRMERLAVDIRVPTAVVQLAVQLGPAGIERHVAAARE